jgi:pilus assembly protein Flp/PilA
MTDLEAALRFRATATNRICGRVADHQHRIIAIRIGFRLIPRRFDALLRGTETCRDIPTNFNKIDSSTERQPTMKGFTKSVTRFLVSEDGPTAVEYAVMLALIVVVCLTAIQAVGTHANTKFNQVATAM